MMMTIIKVIMSISIIITGISFVIGHEPNNPVVVGYSLIAVGVGFLTYAASGE